MTRDLLLTVRLGYVTAFCMLIASACSSSTESSMTVDVSGDVSASFECMGNYDSVRLTADEAASTNLTFACYDTAVYPADPGEYSVVIGSNIVSAHDSVIDGKLDSSGFHGTGYTGVPEWNWIYFGDYREGRNNQYAAGALDDDFNEWFVEAAAAATCVIEIDEDKSGLIECQHMGLVVSGGSDVTDDTSVGAYPSRSVSLTVSW